MTEQGWATYRGGMGSGKKKNAGASDPDRMALVINSAIAQGLDLVAAGWANRPTKRANTSEVRELEKVHKAALARHTQEVSSHRKRLRRAQKRVSTMTTTAAVTGALTVISGVSTAGEGVSPGTAMLAAVTGAAALIAYRSREIVQHPPPEPTAILPAPPPPALRSGARGDAEARRLLRIRSQLVSLIPAVSHLHPEAGTELARADAEAGPALNALVYRLSVLDHIERALPGSEASIAAGFSAEDVRARLAVGVDTYDRLMAAAAAMLSAPDLGRSSDDVLGPAIDALAAYAEGLNVQAQTFSTDLP